MRHRGIPGSRRNESDLILLGSPLRFLLILIPGIPVSAGPALGGAVLPEPPGRRCTPLGLDGCRPRTPDMPTHAVPLAPRSLADCPHAYQSSTNLRPTVICGGKLIRVLATKNNEIHKESQCWGSQDWHLGMLRPL